MKKELRASFTQRQYMLHRDFEIYYYSDTDLSGVRLHTHDYYEFYFFLEGDVILSIDGVDHPLQTGDVILIPPDIPHCAVIGTVSSPYRRFVFWISRKLYKTLSALDPSYVYLMDQVPENRQYVRHYSVIDFHTLQSQVYRLIEEIHSDRYGKTALVTLDVLQLVHFLNRSAYEQDHPLVKEKEQNLCQSLIGYIERNLGGDLSLNRLASEFYVSKYHISHVFKENTGIPLHQFITGRRLSMCRDALLGPGKISDIYLTYGFQDYSSFFRAFKKEFGLSPSEYRALYRYGESGLPHEND